MQKQEYTSPFREAEIKVHQKIAKKECDKFESDCIKKYGGFKLSPKQKKQMIADYISCRWSSVEEAEGGPKPLWKRLASDITGAKGAKAKADAMKTFYNIYWSAITRNNNKEGKKLREEDIKAEDYRDENGEICVIYVDGKMV